MEIRGCEPLKSQSALSSHYSHGETIKIGNNGRSVVPWSSSSLHFSVSHSFIPVSIHLWFRKCVYCTIFIIILKGGESFLYHSSIRYAMFIQRVFVNRVSCMLLALFLPYNIYISVSFNRCGSFVQILTSVENHHG